MKDPGQTDYEADVLKRPTYHTGQPRKQWHELDDVERWSWSRPREVGAAYSLREDASQ
jgi:hypothetical protein